MTTTTIVGFKKVRTTLEKEVRNISFKTGKSLINAAIFIRRDMEVTPPLIPVDTGNLRASWFTQLFRTGNQPFLLLGFTANYAVFVHENVNADFTSPRMRRATKGGKRKMYTPRPGAGAKFLESCLNRNHVTILNIIKGFIQV